MKEKIKMSNSTIFMSDSLKGRVDMLHLSDEIAPSEIFCRLELGDNTLDLLPQKIVTSPGIVALTFPCNAEQVLTILENRTASLKILHSASDKAVLSFENVSILETCINVSGLDSYQVELTVTTRNSA